MPTRTRQEVDRELYEAVPHGGYQRLAEERNVSRQNVSKYYDYKSGEYQSVFSKALLEFQVISRVCPPWARNILSVFNRFGSEWCGPVEVSAETGTVLETVAALAMKLQNPSTPDAQRLQLAQQLVREAEKVRDGLMFDGLEDSPEEIEIPVRG